MAEGDVAVAHEEALVVVCRVECVDHLLPEDLVIFAWSVYKGR